MVEEPEIKVFEGSSASSETTNYTTTEGTVEGVDQDVIFHEEDIVYHDFSDESLVSEVYVDYDTFVDPATSSVSFDPTVMEGTDPELMPARALAVTGLGNSGLQEQAHIGFAALAQSNWQEAADCFRKICESHPTNAAALNNFGLSLLQQALLVQEERPSQHPADEPHFEASVLALRQAAKASQNDASVICNLATALSSCHRHDTALKFYDAALSVDSEDVSSINGKAVSMIGIREFDEATELLRKASALAPDNELISGNLRRISPMG
jgi:tetratricopeptide (TPR) repeat protein